MWICPAAYGFGWVFISVSFLFVGITVACSPGQSIGQAYRQAVVGGGGIKWLGGNCFFQSPLEVFDKVFAL